MRLIVTFEKLSNPLPIHYNHIIQAFIYNINPLCTNLKLTSVTKICIILVNNKSCLSYMNEIEQYFNIYLNRHKVKLNH